jgi:hypothetical protein
MASGWTAVDNDTWLEMVADMTALGVAWPVGLCMADLRFMAGEVRIGKRKRIPSYRKLMDRWGQTEFRTRCAMRSDWRDPLFPKKEKPQKNRNHTANKPQTGEGKPAESAEQPANKPQINRKKVDTRGGEQPTSTTQQDLVSSQATTGQPSAGGKKPERIPQHVRDDFALFRATHTTRAMALDANKGQGRDVAAMVKDKGIGAELLSEIYRWLATSTDDVAKFYRGETSSNAGKQYKARDAKWLRGHLDEVLDAMHARTSRTPHSPPTASARGHEYKTPADRWEGVLQQSGYAAGWHEQIEPEHRARYRAASGAVGGPNALGGITWPPDVKSMKERFNKAYNNYSERK